MGKLQAMRADAAALAAPYREALIPVALLTAMMAVTIASVLGGLWPVALPFAALGLLSGLAAWRALKRLSDEALMKAAALRQMEAYTGELEAMYEDIRTFRHDYINILTTMSGYLEEGAWDELEDYFYTHILPLGRAMEENHDRLGQLKNLHIPEVKSTLAARWRDAGERDIPFTVEAAEPIRTLPVGQLALCRILDDLLDSAIEAAGDSARPWVRVALTPVAGGLDLTVEHSGRGREPVSARRLAERERGLELDLSAGADRFTAVLHCREVGE